MHKNLFSKLKQVNYKLILLGLYLFSCILKIFIIIKVPGPVVFGDEYIYKDLAKQFFEGVYGQNYVTQYPPLYPIILSISFFFNDFYLVMKVINSLVSSLIIFPVWLISRMFLDEKKSYILCIISILIPFNYVYPQLIMSENLMVPLFLLLVYLTILIYVRPTEKNIFFIGIAAGLGYITKYITLVYIFILPIVVLFITGTNRGLVIRRIHLGVLGFLIIYLPWVIFAIKIGIPFREIFGFQVTNFQNNSLITVIDLVKWTTLYLSYFILMISSILPFIIIGINKFKEFKKNELKFILINIIITILYISASIRHSWLAPYNYPTYNYILGRYILYLHVPWLISAFIFIDRISIKNCKKELAIACSLSFVLTVISYLNIVKGYFWKISDYFLIYFNAVDVFWFTKEYNLILICTMYLIVMMSLFTKRITKLKLIYLVLLAYLPGALFMYNNPVVLHKEAVHAKEISKLLKNLKGDEFLYADINYSMKENLQYALKFWELEDKKIKIVKLSQDEIYKTKGKIGNIYVLSGVKLLGHRFIGSYKVNKDSYFIYQLLKSPEITKTYPSIIYVGHKFNKQPNGVSAMAIEGKNFTPFSKIMINGDLLPTSFGGTNSLSVLIPDKYYDKKGYIKIQIKDIFTESKEITLPITIKEHSCNETK
ncbi:4-amino-4-deoxy-L-arabinose transferase [Desulforamulus putei DSM 12395]|uniref:4-amino-4-deoxy-L-arabinose transferase n=1 Tax=Desulforamulus putei DSM 12395 TaxID=1121429 RepID=A0A1M4VJ32_9FIRM|nr:glycosyltransferase family 39 protein [Desulforamulus putei]SHE68968.1 4-amino-4-deoxy-L-arabinose transferase [Desulforamulus putei DSM 12395]